MKCRSLCKYYILHILVHMYIYELQAVAADDFIEACARVSRIMRKIDKCQNFTFMKIHTTVHTYTHTNVHFS